ncbi:MAG TPA: CSLREA domain-containing protein [Thermoanaerobaculia bacterium]|nr:CSLREA domain-containing protein [Thermoanaerobaculia bacterium]
MHRAIRLLLFGLLAMAMSARAAVFTVTKTGDTLDGACNHDCSLREAVQAANGAQGTDVVVVPPGIYVLTRFGPMEENNGTGDLDVRSPLLLVGAGPESTVLDGNGSDRVLDFHDAAEVHGVTVRHGRGSQQDHGGGIQTGSSPVFLHQVVVRDNQTAVWGGGIFAQGPFTLRDSAVIGNGGGDGGGIRGGDKAVLSLANVTISGNRAAYGGGISYPVGTDVTISGSTIAFNEASFAAGGVHVSPLAVTPFDQGSLSGSIVARNSAPQNPDCSGESSLGGNVIGVKGTAGVPGGCSVDATDRAGTAASPLDPGLGGLDSSLGPTPLHPLLPNSPALALVPSGSCESSDQAGQPRSIQCDAGAWESAADPVCVPGGAVLCLQDGRFRVTASWSKSGDGGAALADPVADDTGMFWFFAPDNLELTVKVLNGCPVNQRWWVFSSGLTNVGVDLKVEDLATGRTWTHHQPEFQTYAPRLDTAAFDCALPARSRISSPASPPAPVPSILVVTKTEDTFDGSCDHDCSLREAVAAAQGEELKVVVVGAGIYELTRKGPFEDEGSTGDLDASSPLVILGAGADRTILDGSQTDRVLHAVQFREMEIRGVTVRSGWARGTTFGDNAGGGIHAGSLILVDSVVSGNRAEHGGGIWALDLTARNSTISGNIGIEGGGIFTGTILLENVTLSGNLGRYGGGLYRVVVEDHSEILNSTVTGNSATVEGGGLYASEDITCPASHEDDGCPDEPFIRIFRSVVAGNTAPADPDCANLRNEGGWNVFGVGDSCNASPTDEVGTIAAPLDPKLTDLGNHGGSTPTHAPLLGSPALDLGPLHFCPAEDQRHRPRASGSGCDAGSVERLPFCQPDEDTLCLGLNDRFRVTVHWTAQGNEGPGKAHPLRADSGAFWFFDPDNLELTVKVLNGCGVNQRYWVFLSGLTDVGVEATVEDTSTGETWTYANPPGTPLQPTLDTAALEVCP